MEHMTQTALQEIFIAPKEQVKQTRQRREGKLKWHLNHKIKYEKKKKSLTN